MQITLAAVALFFSAAFAAPRTAASDEQYKSDLSALEADGCDTVSK